MTALAALDHPTVADHAVPYGPLTFVEQTTRSGYEAIARLHDEAMAAIAALAEGEDPSAEEAPVLRMSDRPAVAVRPAGAVAA